MATWVDLGEQLVLPLLAFIERSIVSARSYSNDPQYIQVYISRARYGVSSEQGVTVRRNDGKAWKRQWYEPFPPKEINVSFDDIYFVEDRLTLMMIEHSNRLQ